jgi:hypothetical protein
VCNKSANSLHIVCKCLQLVCTYSLKSLHIICTYSAKSLHAVFIFTSSMSVCVVFALGSNDHWLQPCPTHLSRQGQDLYGDPPEPDMGLHWDDREPCPFSREEGEAFCTYVSSDMSRCSPEHSRLLKIIVCPTQTLSGGRLGDASHGPRKPPMALCRLHAHSMHTQCTLYAHLWRTLQTWRQSWP